MNCWKCGKDLEPPKDCTSYTGIEVEVILDTARKTTEQIEYNNKQLGKYSDGKGECHVSICYECYIDGLFHI